MNRNIFITGSAGTGKSYLTQEIVKRSPDNRKIYLTSSTGISAIQIGGVTIYRLLGLGLCNGNPVTLARLMRNRDKLYKLWKGMDTLIIDEISMLDIGLFVRVSEMMKIVRGDKRPWGGIQLILVGDFMQLPPVNSYEDSDNKVYRYLFQHPIWEELDLGIVHLTESKRTDNMEYFECLKDIRLGILSDQVRKLVKSCSRRPVKKDGIIPTILIATNREVDQFNMEMLDKLPPINSAISSYAYTGEFSTSVPNTIIDPEKNKQDIMRHCLAPNPLYLREGAQVMLLVNKLDLGLCNGSRGVVIGFSDEKYRSNPSSPPLPVVQFKNGKVLTIEPHIWSSSMKVGEDKYITSYTMLPLKLAWSITIHKSQGLTLDSAIVKVDNCFAGGQLYVALSRCKDPNEMYIQGWDDSAYVRSRPDNSVIEFYENLHSNVDIDMI